MAKHVLASAEKWHHSLHIELVKANHRAVPEHRRVDECSPTVCSEQETRHLGTTLVTAVRVRLLPPHRLYATKLLCPWQEYWNGLPFPSPGDLPDPGIEPISPAWLVCSLLLSDQRSPITIKMQTALTSAALFAALVCLLRVFFEKCIYVGFSEMSFVQIQWMLIAVPGTVLVPAKVH